MTPGERKQRDAWTDAARRLGLVRDLGTALADKPRRTIFAAMSALAERRPKKRAAILELRDVIGERASDAERSRRYRERQNPTRAAQRRTTCRVCGAALIGRRQDAVTCSPTCRTALARARKRRIARATGDNREMARRLRAARRRLAKAREARQAE